MKIKLTKIAKKFIDKQSGHTREKIDAALLGLQNLEGDVKKIDDNMYRLKIYKYRIIFELEDDTIIVVNIDSRGDVYKKGGLR